MPAILHLRVSKKDSHTEILEDRVSKKVDRMGKERIKKNLILSKPAGCVLEASLNPKMSGKIRVLGGRAILTSSIIQ